MPMKWRKMTGSGGDGAEFGWRALSQMTVDSGEVSAKCCAGVLGDVLKAVEI